MISPVILLSLYVPMVAVYPRLGHVITTMIAEMVQMNLTVVSLFVCLFFMFVKLTLGHVITTMIAEMVRMNSTVVRLSVSLLALTYGLKL